MRRRGDGITSYHFLTRYVEINPLPITKGFLLQSIIIIIAILIDSKYNYTIDSGLVSTCTVLQQGNGKINVG